MKKLLILVMLLVIGAGAAAYFVLGKKDEQVAEEPKEEKIVVEEHHYMKLDTITVTLFDEESVVGLYTAALTLELAQADQRRVVSAAESRLRDAMIRELHSLVVRRKGVDIPLDSEKRRLRATAICELGSDVVLDLYIENVLRKDS
jgi:flagellar basal body-associated protein FliL